MIKFQLSMEYEDLFYLFYKFLKLKYFLNQKIY